jgi:Na+-transporting methylmalonyl-CoA/oxaloacetate decarboxylase beta subunit
LEWGIENPLIHISIYQGVVVAALIVLGLLLMFAELVKRLEPQVIFPMILYFLLVNSFGSFAGRFLNLTMFLIVISALFRRQNASSDHVV